MMSLSMTTIQITFTNGSQQVYQLDVTDGVNGGELLELVSGNGLGTAATGLTPKGLIASCENTLSYWAVVDNLGVYRYTGGGINPESMMPEEQRVPASTIGLNWQLQAFTLA